MTPSNIISIHSYLKNHPDTDITSAEISKAVNISTRTVGGTIPLIGDPRISSRKSAKGHTIWRYKP